MTTVTRVTRLAAAFAALVALLAWSAGAAAAPQAKKKGDKDGKDDKPGAARWEWKILDDKGKSVQTGTFKIEGRKKVTATFTKGPMKGEVALVLSERKPVAYRGDLVRPDGTKSPVELVIIND